MAPHFKLKITMELKEVHFCLKSMSNVGGGKCETFREDSEMAG